MNSFPNNEKHFFKVDRDVFLTIKVGNSHIGHHTIHIDDKKVELEDDENINELELKFNSERKSHLLEIDSNISQIDLFKPAIITYILTGGVEIEDIKQKDFNGSSVGVYTEFILEIDSF